MNRIGIFIFYDTNGQADAYIETLLGAMQKILKRLVIVVNGKIVSKGYDMFRNYTEDIFIRENHGYDAGAYKDVFTKFLIGERWEKWDEIILFNDTFYGPFYPLDDIFQGMEKGNADFWGLSRHPEGIRKLSAGEDMPSHIQGYFMVCRKSLFLSAHWNEFWDNLVYPASYDEAVERFEVHFSQYFMNKGYRSGAWTDKSRIEFAKGENPYLCYLRELVQEIKFPILKRKTIRLEYLEEVKNVTDYIRSNTGYDIGLIISHIRRLSMEGLINPIAPFDTDKLEQFYHEHKRIFLYGYGAYGKGISAYFAFKGWKHDGFIVSENKEDNVRLRVYEEMEFDTEDGIILALGKVSFNEVYPIVKKDLNRKQLFYPKYENDYEERI